MNLKCMVGTLLFIVYLTNISCNKRSESRKQVLLTDSVSYVVEKKDLANKPTSASFDIRLQNQISKAGIKVIANDILKKNRGFRYYLISYWVPEVHNGKQPWATSYFDTTVDSLFIDFPKQSNHEKFRLAPLLKPDGEIIGMWGGEATIVFFKRNNQLYIRYIQSVGNSISDVPINQIGQKYFLQNNEGYYVIKSDSNLEFHGRNGQIGIVQKAF